ncbi:hypothetical protein [Alkalicoccus luteus]|uniref:GerMN domain-containing protein n=1 Tax=Alkalicoccus luteus TaxID=1237094 RepID=A0A969PQT0_9BACI|nr:hypothetical protein [Alkalicoccus luteus]NJP38711.1 hypothetical protein [Alkalicoccus luteus]
MSRRKWSEDDIEKTLTKLPKIEDRRSKDELFQAVEKQRGGRMPSRMEQRKRQWFFPAMASAAAVLLVVLMIPSFMNSGMFMSGDDMNSAEQNNMSTMSESDLQNDAADQAGNENTDNADNDPSNSAPQNDGAEEEGADIQVNQEEEAADNDPVNTSPGEADLSDNILNNEENNGNGMQEAQIDYGYEEEGTTYVTAAVEEENGSLVTLTPESGTGLTKAEAVTEALAASDPTEEEGVFSLLESIELHQPEEGAVSLYFEEGTDFSSLSSAQTDYALEVLQEVLSIHQINQVYFFEGDEPLEFGPVGETNVSLSLMNRGFYQVEGNLVSARQAGAPMTNGAGEPLTFDETIEEMAASEEESYSSIVPEEVTVSDVRYEDETAFVFFSDEGAPEEDFQLFKQAVELTAKYFTLDTVQFVNNEEEEVTVIPLQLPEESSDGDESNEPVNNSTGNNEAVNEEEPDEPDNNAENAEENTENVNENVNENDENVEESEEDENENDNDNES